MSTITTYEGLCKALRDAIHGKPLEYISTESRKSGTRLNLISRAIGRYYAAEAVAPSFGLIGVGVISFANARLAKFCRKVNLTA